MISVVIAEDQPMIRAAFAALIGSQPDMEVLAVAGDAAAAVEAVRTHRPTVTIMDLRMPLGAGPHGTNLRGVDPRAADSRAAGVIATQQITSAALSRVLVLTTFREEELVVTALEAGAAGFLLKDSEPAVLLQALRRVAAGEGFLDPAVTPMILRRVRQPRQARPRHPAPPPAAGLPVANLTSREAEVLGLVCEGLSNKDIARRLFIAETTVKSHVKAILGKTGTRDRVGLVIWAARRGLVR
ncbi:LuxR C-terminal-related transcriptional regulator [Corynebacterium uterequi]|uniref:Two component transcriptional regulator, LuxR family n=1 Tax=Corynebacterium uterequi TaxID=1072256 RepID=A0A0G3HEF8_9CORY|nr:response regulator transcription factor [Corynebacterium uterequi]AKK10353.1 two component transcriptional regulator, LuxR family [Corynebacterium uterequi]